MDNYKKQIALSQARIEQVKAAMRESTSETNFFFVVGEQMVCLDQDIAAYIASQLISYFEADIRTCKGMINSGNFNQSA